MTQKKKKTLIERDFPTIHLMQAYGLYDYYPLSNIKSPTIKSSGDMEQFIKTASRDVEWEYTHNETLDLGPFQGESWGENDEMEDYKTSLEDKLREHTRISCDIMKMLSSLQEKVEKGRFIGIKDKARDEIICEINNIENEVLNILPEGGYKIKDMLLRNRSGTTESIFITFLKFINADNNYFSFDYLNYRNYETISYVNEIYNKHLKGIISVLFVGSDLSLVHGEKDKELIKISNSRLVLNDIEHKAVDIHLYFNDWLHPSDSELNMYQVITGKIFDICEITKLFE